MSPHLPHRRGLMGAVAGGGVSLDALMAAQEAGILYRFGEIAALYKTTDESSPVTTIGDVIGRVNDQRVGPGSPANATQSNGTYRPTHQANGARFDNLDDFLATAYAAGPAANFILARVTVPASLSGVQLVAGSFSTGPSSACFLGFNTAGQVVGGAGTQSFTTILGTSDLRGTEAVVGIAFEVGGLVRLFVNNAIEYEAASAGTPNTSLGFYIGARNSSGTASAIFGGEVKTLAAGRQMLDLATFRQTAAAL